LNSAISLLVKAFFSFIGLSYTTIKLFGLLKDIVKPMFYFEQNLAEKYGKGSWAVITGGSDGIGLEFCYQLASQGFNIVIIARNEEKSKAAGAKIMEKYENIAVKVITADFVNCFNEGFFEGIIFD